MCLILWFIYKDLVNEFIVYVFAECKEVLLNTFRGLFAQLPQECQLALPQLPPKLIETLREIGVMSN